MYVLTVTRGRTPARVAWEPGRLARRWEDPAFLAAARARAARREEVARRMFLARVRLEAARARWRRS